MMTRAQRTGLLFATALSLAPVAAVAQQAPNTPIQSRLDLFGSAPSACVLNRPSSQNNTNASVSTEGSNATQVTITNMVAGDLTPKAATVNLAFPLICNGPNTVTVTTTNGGLTLVGGAPSAAGFTDHVDYTLQAAWAGKTSSVSTGSARTLQISSGDGAAGVMSLTIQITGGAGGNRLIAGAYSDTLTLDVQPAT